MKILKKNHRQIKMNRFYKNKKIVIISMLILFGVSSPAQINKKINTKVSTRNIKSKNIKLVNKIPLLIATNKNINKSISSTNINKRLNMEKAKSFNEKIPKDYRPSSGKLYRKLTAQKPFYNNAYLEYLGAWYKPMAKIIVIGTSRNGHLTLKLKPKINKRYLIRMKITDKIGGGSPNNYDDVNMMVSIGNTKHSFAINKTKDFEFEFVVQSETYNWIEILIYSDDGSSSFPWWSFVSATISEL